MQGEPMFESHIPTLSEKKGKKQKRKRKRNVRAYLIVDSYRPEHKRHCPLLGQYLYYMSYFIIYNYSNMVFLKKKKKNLIWYKNQGFYNPSSALVFLQSNYYPPTSTLLFSRVDPST